MSKLINKILFLLLCSICLLSWNGVSAQHSRVPYSQRSHPYIQYDSCYLEHCKENPNLTEFYKKLDKLYFTGKGQVKIMQIGGSHIQAGMWSFELRKRFESLSPSDEGFPGLVFPFSLAKTNHPFYYHSECEGEWEISKITDKVPVDSIGLSGITARTNDSLASIKIVFYPVAGINERSFDKVSVFHNIEDTSYLLSIMPLDVVDTSFINYETRSTEFYLKNSLDTLEIRFVKQDTSDNSMFFYGAYLENSSPGIEYSGIGINGAATSSYLKAELFETHLKAVKPDLVIFSIGVNDAAGKSFSKQTYISNYKIIANKILEINSDCAFIFTTNNDFYHYRGGVNLHYKDVYEAMISLSQFYDASVWNMFKVMGGYKSINYWRNDNLAKKDRIHFTKEGYVIVAGLLFDAILQDYENHLEKEASTK
ncbi:MAG: GDSL-type esterase/lipase family protein [Bacteroidales bacterium]|nr:GDSL-type esterase/lipase family protein [Bacteroidales bacterium]